MVNVLLRLLDDGDVCVEALRRQREVDEGWNKIVQWEFSAAALESEVTFQFTVPIPAAPVVDLIS